MQILSLQLSPKYDGPNTWSEVSLDEFDHHQEVIGLFLKDTDFSNKKYVSDELRSCIQKLLEKQEDSVKTFSYNEPQSIWKAALNDLSPTACFKINLDVLDEIPINELNNNASMKDEFFNQLLDFISRFSTYNKKISFSFQEVFWVPEGASPPSNYRKGIDTLESDLHEYKKKVSTVSYQIKKSLFYIYKPNDTLTPTHLHVTQYANQTALSNNINPVLKNIHSFSNCLEASLILTTLLKRCRALSSPLIHLAFGPAVTLSGLPKLLNHLFFSSSSSLSCNFREMLLTLQGPQYTDPTVRSKVRDTIKQVIKQSRLPIMFHVVLLTSTETQNKALFDLEPNKNEEVDGFSPLTEGYGYYLSDPNMFSTVLRNIQTQAQTHPSILTLTPSNPSDHFSVTPAEEGNFRETKRWNKTQFQSKITLSLTQALNQSATQTQEVSEEQTLSHHQEISQKNQMTQHLTQQVQRENTYFFNNTLDFNGFCEQLKKQAEIYLQSKTTPTNTHNFYSTESYRRHRDFFWSQMASNDEFRAQCAANVFQTGYTFKEGKPQPIFLPKISVDNIACHVLWGINDIEERLPDGIHPNDVRYSRSVFGSRTISSISNAHMSVDSNRIGVYVPEHSLLPIMSVQYDKPECWQLPLDGSVMLSDGNNTIEQINFAKNLLQIYNPNRSFTSEEITALENQLIQLTASRFEKRPEYAALLKDFISIFEEHTLDNLKIMVQLLMTDQQQDMLIFLHLLRVLEPKCLLKHVYRLYIKDAGHVCSLSSLMNQNKSSVFLTLVEQTPNVHSPEEWPDFETFAHHILLYYAGLRQNIETISWETIDTFWQNTHTKFLMYCNHQNHEANELMHQFVMHLVSSDHGLHILPVTQIVHLFDGLDCMINNAMLNHTLHEQIKELKGVSLLPMYAPYAIKHHDFKLVSQEMMLSPNAMDPVTKGYSVSSELLRQHLLEETPAFLPLKTLIFRYLGGQVLREELEFYRNLFDTKTENDLNDLNDLIVGYFVLTHTGEHYRPRLENERFKSEFHAFMQKKQPSYDHVQVETSLESFITRHQNTPRDELKGSTSLWQICSNELQNIHPLPAILTKKFDEKQIIRFLIMHRDELVLVSKSLPALPNTTKKLLQILIDTHFNQQSIKNASKKILLALFLYCNPTDYRSPLKFDFFTNNLVKLNALIEGYSHIIQNDKGTRLFTALKNLLDTTHSLDDVLICLELLTPQVSVNPSGAVLFSATFIEQLITKKTLLNHLKQAQSLLQEALDDIRTTNLPISQLDELLNITERLFSLDAPDAKKTLQRLIPLWLSPDGHLFFQTFSLTAAQLKQTTELIERFHLPFAFFLHGLNENSSMDFSDIASLLNTRNQEQVLFLSTISLFLFKTGSPFLDTITQLNALSDPLLEKLSNLIELGALSQEELTTLLKNPVLEEAVQTIELELYTKNLSRFSYDPHRIARKIADIRCLSGKNGDDCPLNTSLQEQLLQDYHRTIDSTLHQLNQEQCQHLFLTLKHSIIHKKQQPHEHLLRVLGLCCEVLYRTQGKFPRDTQLISILNALRQKGPILQGIKTSEGKSLIIAIHSVLLCAQGQTVNLATENNKLAWDALTHFRGLYRYLGIPCATDVLQADSPRSLYVDHGINFSTAAGFELFSKQMLLEGKLLPTKISLLLDEGDANLTSTVQFRLAASLNPLFHDMPSWSLVYDALLDFVQEPEIFINNPCSRAEDIRHFKNYCSLKTEFVHKIPNDLIDELIQAAQTAWSLEEDIHFSILPKNKEKTRYCAAPILDNTKRPDGKVSYSHGVQPLLHARLKRQYGTRYTFETEPHSETLIVSSMKNALDRYRLNGGEVLCFTATPGSDVEINEFNAHHHLTSFYYPSFFDEILSENLGLLCAKNTTDQQALIIKTLKSHQENNPEQPCLIITRDPKSAMAFTQALRQDITGFIQCYLGDDQQGDIEESIIQRAGMNSTITVTTESLARGADFKTNHPRGHFLINACTQITKAKHVQINGRAGRNGKPGAYLSIINQEELIVPFSDHADHDNLEAIFQANQHQISLNEQRERLKTRLLEETRDYIVTDHLLALCMKANAVFKRQAGQDYVFMNQSVLLTTLRDLNQRAEDHYTALLGEKAQLTEDEREMFLDAFVEDYQKILDRFLPEGHFESFEVTEPLIPLEAWQSLPELDDLRAADLSVVSGLLSCGWRYMGNQKMRQMPFILDQLLIGYEPYLKGQKSFKFSTAALLKKYLDMNRINTTDVIEVFLAQEKNVHEFIDLFKQIPVIGLFLPIEKIKAELSQYIKNMADHIQKEAWDNLSLPEFNNMMNNWYNGLTQVAQVTSAFAIVAAGPIPFVIQYVIIPTLGSFLKHVFKDSESMHMQLLLGLDCILSDIQRALLFLTNIRDAQSMRVGDLLDQVGPLLKNKTFVVLLSYALKQNRLEHWIPYLNALPDVLDTLHPYRAQSLKELLTGERLMGWMLQAAQMDIIKNTMSDNETFQVLLTKIPSLKPDFLSTFNTLSATQLVGFIKVAAHPECFKFLNQLPPETRFKKITHWLNSDNIPLEIKTYQKNRERIEQDTKQSLLSLRHQFSVSKGKIKHHLEQLNHQTTAHVPPPFPQPEIPWIKIIGYGVLSLGLLAVNLLFFSIPLAVTTGLLLGYYAYCGIKNALENTTCPHISPGRF
ncbi:MAG: hypothetical protein GW760_07845 [Legionella sp.]|nr:hypothetical protein [Legionella sp.]